MDRRGPSDVAQRILELLEEAREVMRDEPAAQLLFPLSLYKSLDLSLRDGMNAAKAIKRRSPKGTFSQAAEVIKEKRSRYGYKPYEVRLIKTIEATPQGGEEEAEDERHRDEPEEVAGRDRGAVVAG